MPRRGSEQMRLTTHGVNGADSWAHGKIVRLDRAQRMQHRLHVERALSDVSQQFVLSSEVDLKQMLSILGEAIGAGCMYLITLPQDDASLHTMTPREANAAIAIWHYEGEAAEDHWLAHRGGDAEPTLHLLTHEPLSAQKEDGRLSGIAIPILSSEDRLYGYLGMEYQGSELLAEDHRALCVLGSLLVSYFRRTAAEQTLREREEHWRRKSRESEEQHNAVVETISEAIWRIDLKKPVAVDAPVEEQVAHILKHGYLAECNQVMAHLLGAKSPDCVVGQKMATVLPFLDRRFVADFAQAGYRLHNREVAIRASGQPPRRFAVNAQGSMDRDRIVRLWGSCREVTEGVEMERRIVAVLEEQQEHIGRDLHDSVGQLLTGIRMLSSNLATRYFNVTDEGFEVARKVAVFAEEASGYLRHIYRGLAPPHLYQDGLILALEELIYNLDALPGFTCTLIHDGRTGIHDRETKVQLYRIVQEAANNALKHGQPKNIWITLKQHKGQIMLQIRDDGIGFDVENAATTMTTLGLYSMQRRAHSIMAELLIDSSMSVGTTVTCTLREEG